MLWEGLPGVSPNVTAFTLLSAFNAPISSGWSLVPGIRVVEQ